MNNPGAVGGGIKRQRIESIDLVRGIVMVLMAIDHVRVYSGVPAGGPEYGVFFTRWVTHFCAPAFVFLAGTSAFLYGRKGTSALPGESKGVGVLPKGVSESSRSELSRYLVVRGLLLVVLELTVIRFCWTFNFNYAEFTLAGIIWMLGWCMVLMAGLVRLKPGTVGIIGVAIVAFQQVFALLPGLLPAAAQRVFGYFWEFVYPSGLKGPPGVTILYVLVPWIGVMAMGYSFGQVLLMDARRRRRICLWVGLSAIALFLIAGSILAWRPAPDSKLPFLLRLLNQRKYPASPLFLLMTLGPLVAALPWAEAAGASGRGASGTGASGRGASAKGASGRMSPLADALRVFGRVPMFFYLLHIPLIHAGALLINIIREGSTGQGWYATAPYVFIPPDQRWSLGLLYAEWAGAVVLLYFLCRWYDRYKSKHRGSAWLKYL